MYGLLGIEENKLDAMRMYNSMYCENATVESNKSIKYRGSMFLE